MLAEQLVPKKHVCGYHHKLRSPSWHHAKYARTSIDRRTRLAWVTKADRWRSADNRERSEAIMAKAPAAFTHGAQIHLRTCFDVQQARDTTNGTWSQKRLWGSRNPSVILGAKPRTRRRWDSVQLQNQTPKLLEATAEQSSQVH